jgi:alcohol dehydrogenase class IV
MIPRTVVFDPALTMRTPLGLWLSTGMRAVDHAVESFSSPYGSPFVDGTSLQALRTLPGALKRTKRDPHDIEARADAQAGMWLSRMGMWSLVPMGASHGIGPRRHFPRAAWALHLRHAARGTALQQAGDRGQAEAAERGTRRRPA